MLPAIFEKYIVVDKDILNGTPVFNGTRVPVKTLFDYLSSGQFSLFNFLEDYPSVNPNDAKQLLTEMPFLIFDEKNLTT